MEGTSAGSTAIASAPSPDNASLVACQGSGTNVDGLVSAASMPFPNMSSRSLACMSNTRALISAASVPYSIRHLSLSRACIQLIAQRQLELLYNTKKESKGKITTALSHDITTTSDKLMLFKGDPTIKKNFLWASDTTFRSTVVPTDRRQ
jgi:hypothetical protein